MLWQIALAFLVIFVLWKLFTAEELYKDVPGPDRIPILGNTVQLMKLSHSELFYELINYNKLYGNRIMIKLFNHYVLHVFDVKDIEIMLSHTKNIQKSQPYVFLQPWLGTGLLVSTGSKWHKRRKILTPAFHFDILKNFCKVFEDHSRGLVNELQSQVKKNNSTVDLMPFVSDFTLFAICETAMGTQLNEGESKMKLEYKQSILGIGHIILKRLITFYLHNDAIFSMFPIGKQFAKHVANVHTFADNVIMERKKQVEGKELISKDATLGERRRLALLDLLLEAERRGEIDLEGIREEVNTFMFEGHDTTAIAITFGLMLIADYDDVQERLYEECTSILGSDASRIPTPSELGEMKYLEAVTKEILRLYPSVPVIGREVVEAVKLGDVEIKPGCEVIIHIYDVQRNPELFPEPDEFKPERFMTGEKRNPYAYVPFSAGPRNCIGQRFAKLEMKYFFTEIIRNFKMQLPTKGWRPKLKCDLVLRTDDKINVKFTPR